MLKPRILQRAGTPRPPRCQRRWCGGTRAPYPCQRQWQGRRRGVVGEVHVVTRVRHHRTDIPLIVVEQPAPTGGGETRLPDLRGVAPFKEVPDETCPTKVVLHLAGTFDDGLHHLHRPRGPMGCPVVSPISLGFHGGGGRTEVLEPLRIHCGVVLHSHHSTQDRVTVSPRGVHQFTKDTFQRHHLRLDTPQSGRRENPFEGPPGEPVVGEEHTIVARMCKPPSRAQRMLTSSTGV